MNKDIFVLIPIDGNLKNGECKSADNIGNKIVEVLNETADYECEKLISESIERTSLGTIMLSYMDDEYSLEKIEWLEANVIGCYQSQTKLGIIQLVIPQCEKEATQFGDMIASKHLMIQDRGVILPLDKYMENVFHVKICGKIRAVYCINKEDAVEREIEYMLAGETVVSQHIDYRIRDDELKEMAEKNLSSYDFYDLFASPNAVVYCINDFCDNILANISGEALLLFICEIAILQNSAISRINRQIVDELLDNSDISARKTLRLQVEFGKTILLWDNDIYNYYLAQRVSDKIIDAFGTQKLFDEYKRNKEHIEQIASLKSGIASETEGKILNILAFILSISELIQLIGDIKKYIMGMPIQYGVAGGTTLALLIVLIAITKNRRIRAK